MSKNIMLMAIASVLWSATSYASQSGLNKLDLELVPVKETKTPNEDCFVFEDQALYPLSRKPVLKWKDLDVVEKGEQVQLVLSEKEKHRLKKAIKKAKNTPLAVVSNGEVIAKI